MIDWSKLESGMFLKHKPTGEKFEVIFQGNEGDALEVFSGYKVTDENGDGMTYYKRGDP